MKPFKEYFHTPMHLTEDKLFSSSFNEFLFLEDSLDNIIPKSHAKVVHDVVWNLCEDIRVLKEENAKLGGGK